MTIASITRSKRLINIERIPSITASRNLFVTLSTSFSSNLTAMKTLSYNLDFNEHFKKFNEEYKKNYEKLLDNLKKDADYTGSRDDAVKLAREYEMYDIKMGGKGSGDWTRADFKSIRQGKWIKSAQGHHIKNVANHKIDQADPNNIKFYRNQKDHLNKGHKGNFQNPSDGKLIDKNKMIIKTNKKRILMNELKGLGIAVLIGVGIGFTISLVTELAINRIDKESIKHVLIHSIKSGVESGLISGASYGVSRATEYFLNNCGLNLSSKLSSTLNIGITGICITALTSVILYFKYKKMGYSSRDAMSQILKTATTSLSLIAVSMALTYLFGKVVSLFVSSSIGVIFFAFSLRKFISSKINEEKILVDTHEKLKELALKA